MSRPLLLLAALAAAVAGCTDDPRYVRAPMQAGLEVGAAAMDPLTGTATTTLPIALETMADATRRAARATALGVDVPYVRLDDLSVSLEWTIKNLTDADGMARIKVNGANAYFRYVPTAFVVDPEEDPVPPPLMGDVPLAIAAGQAVSGTFREDQVREASIDLEQITRGMVNPFAAMLTVNKHDPGVTIPPALVPLADLGLIVEYDVGFEADRHMILEYELRVRDHRGILHDDLLFAPADQLTTFAPADFAPPPPAP